MDVAISICLGIGLAAATGLRVFIPLLALSIAARLEVVTLTPSLEWVGSTPALVILGVAVVLEVGSYLIPVVDHILDTVATPAAAVAGTFVMGAVLTEMDPVWVWTLAVIAGGGTATVVQGTTIAARAASTATTAGTANPVLAGTEAAGSAGLSILAFVIPVITALLVIVAIAYVLSRVPKLLRWAGRRASPPPGR